MIPDLGTIALGFAFGTAVYAALAAWYGHRTDQPRWVESARNATIITLPLVALACFLLIISLLRSDFSIEYVWRVSSRGMPDYLKVTALWGGQAGSLLFWNFLLAVFTAAAMMRNWRRQRELMAYAIMVASFTQIFFLGLSLFIENPFNRLAFVSPDGNGLNPLLRHPGMIIHPPMLYLGFVGFTIPYAFGMAALMSGKLDDTWIRLTRRWTLVAWLFLSLGLILGGRWAYDVLGWGGYWAWDPVENASLMPWLAGTAFLHSVMIQEKRDMFKMWNMFLIVLTFCLVISGTFIVRSGVISSVHSFAQSAIGPLFFGFIAIMFVFSVYWLSKRHEALKSENHLNSFLSREAAFLYNNFLILAILAVVFLFTYYPIFSELITGEKGFVGPPVYEQATGPLFGALVLLMGVAPMTMWYRTSAQRIGMGVRWPALAALIFIGVLIVLGIRDWRALLGLWIVSFAAILTLLEFWKGTRGRMKAKGEPPWTAFATLMGRNRRRYGGYWIHMGVIVMAFGIISMELFQEQTQIRLTVGDTLSLGRYEMQFLGASRFPGPDDLLITQATVDVYDNGRYVGQFYPRTELYTRTNQPMTIPDARSTISEDFYMLMINWEPTSSNQATFRVYLNPLVNWVWAGGIIFVIGTLIAAWPDRKEELVTVSRPHQTVLAGGD
ncbi:MAG: heme lyase CcmF/NrfE family subunit [Chloroflexi bacterium]|nr:heme lyase CcmF/NrfE family subunit [Ardenticatenaceae bacterium]MBL1127490.1 heme lyase CcmF/NrfE family subunit [Chloroflexota bacterium]NOG33553.1 heme lyase CcmF/NrfE family subunit [Chloroflexota bacterium]GIK55751.1 MAG: c-type cytochrome biogenesis protein CcmF [Chloroflexota bacterium]